MAKIDLPDTQIPHWSHMTPIAKAQATDFDYCPRCGALLDHLTPVGGGVQASPCGCRLMGLPKAWRKETHEKTTD